MTLEELKHSKKDILSASDVSNILEIHPSRLIEYGRKKELPFPCFISGCRVKFPRIAFINWMEGRNNP